MCQQNCHHGSFWSRSSLIQRNSSSAIKLVASRATLERNNKILQLARQRKFDALRKILLQEIHRLSSKYGPSHNITKIAKECQETKSNVTMTTYRGSEYDNTIYNNTTKAVPDCQNNCAKATKRNSTLLHQILSYRPTFAIIDLVCELQSVENALDGRSTRPEDVQDTDGCTPLQLAIKNLCNVNVISRLLKGDGSVVSPLRSVDNQGRTALHWASIATTKEFRMNEAREPTRMCAFSVWYKKDGYECSDSDIEEMRKAIEILGLAYPHASTIRDVSGNTPLDLAVQYQADTEIVMALADARTFLQQRLRPQMHVPFTRTKKPSLHDDIDFCHSPNDIVERRPHLCSTNNNYLRSIVFALDDLTDKHKLCEVSQLDFIIESSLSDDRSIDDDISSIGSRGISKHDRQYDQFDQISI